MDLSTTYLGLHLAHPVIAGASPLCDDLDMVRRLEDAGAAAIVMHSLFEEQIEREARRTLADAEVHDAFAEAKRLLAEAGPRIEPVGHSRSDRLRFWRAGLAPYEGDPNFVFPLLADCSARWIPAVDPFFRHAVKRDELGRHCPGVLEARGADALHLDAEG